MAHNSFMKRVLDAALGIIEKNGEATCVDISAAVMVQTREQHKKVLNVLSDLAKANRVSRIRQGVYGCPAPDAGKKPDKCERMWRLLKIRRQVTVDDMVELAGVSRSYALEWLQLMVKRKAAVKNQQPGKEGIWSFTGEMSSIPVDVDKAARLRDLRLRKKEQAMKRLDAISVELGRLRHDINDMEVE